MRRRAAALAVLLAAALLASGCQATWSTDVSLDREGRGSVAMQLKLDAASQEALGLPTSEDPATAAQRFAPMLEDAGWSGGESQIAASRDEGTGELVLETRHLVDSTSQLDRILSLDRPLTAIPAEPSALASLTDLPQKAPILNAFDFRLGNGSGDNPGFNLFARGGVGDIGDETCSGNSIKDFGRSLRDSLEIRYRFRLPGGPGSTNATQTPASDNLWIARYGDCPALQASAGGGSSSTLVNGLILAGLTGLLLVVFALRAVRRRRGTGSGGV